MAFFRSRPPVNIFETDSTTRETMPGCVAVRRFADFERGALVVPFRAALRGDLAAAVFAGFLVLTAAVLDWVAAARELCVRDMEVRERDAAAFPFPVVDERPVFAVDDALPAPADFFFAAELRAVVVFTAELRLPVAFLTPPEAFLAPAVTFFAAAPRPVAFTFEAVVVLVVRELDFFATDEDFFAGELFLPPVVLRAEEPGLFFAPPLFFAGEREPAVFLVVAIAICPSKIIGIGLIQ